MKKLFTSSLLIVCVLTVSAQPLTSTRNKVAVLPMTYIGDGSDYDRNEEMQYRLQQFAIDILSQSSAELKFQDPASINARLRKKGINESNIRDYTPGELAEILQVEYIIMGSVLQDRGPQVTVTNSQHVRRQERDSWGHDYRSRERDYRVGRTVTNQHFRTEVSLSIYNGEGERIYSKSRESILSDADAYKAAIRYMLKRTPLYNR